MPDEGAGERKVNKNTVTTMMVVRAIERAAKGAAEILEETIAPSLMSAKDNVESPIEILLLCALEAVSIVRWRSAGMTWRNFDMLKSCAIDRDEIFIIPQFPIVIDRMNCRVDLMIAQGPEARPMVAVECDGHDYHERTKEQARRDRARDRAIQMMGIASLRFTGSEINEDPCGCALQVLDYLDR